MAVMLILIGLPASGKSTYARELMASEPDTWARISWDDIRHEKPDYRFNSKNEEEVRIRSFGAVRDAAEAGLSVIIDNTNLTYKTIAMWVRLAEELGMKVKTERFDTPVEECVRRDNHRKGNYAQGGGHVGRVVIERMALANGLIEWGDRPIVIVDVDGTLADCTHRRRDIPKKCQPCKGTGFVYGYNGVEFNAKLCCQDCSGDGHVPGTDWKYFFQKDKILADPPFPIIVKWVQELWGHYTVLIVSGRSSDLAGDATVEWLKMNHVPYNHIFMRQGSDKRDDVLVKGDILRMLPKHQIAFCIDDRNRVVDMWRENGLTCYQVISREEGDF